MLYCLDGVVKRIMDTYNYKKFILDTIKFCEQFTNGGMIGYEHSWSFFREIEYSSE